MEPRDAMSAERRILIIDDDEMDSTAMATVLRSAGYAVVICSDGEEGLRQARERVPDLIIVDLLMRPPDGFEVCRRLEQDERLRSVPRLVVTALPEKLHKALESFDIQGQLDVDDCVAKPVDLGTLAEHVRQILDAKRSGP